MPLANTPPSDTSPSSGRQVNRPGTSAVSRANLVVLNGFVATAPDSRTLPSGAVAVQFDVRTVLGDASTTSVPVSWIDPPADALRQLLVDEDVVVIGTVKRRFFRTGGATQSRTEVVAEKVIPARRARSARSAIVSAAHSLGN